MEESDLKGYNNSKALKPNSHKNVRENFAIESEQEVKVYDHERRNHFYNPDLTILYHGERVSFQK